MYRMASGLIGVRPAARVIARSARRATVRARWSLWSLYPHLTGRPILARHSGGSTVPAQVAFLDPPGPVETEQFAIVRVLRVVQIGQGKLPGRRGVVERPFPNGVSGEQYDIGDDKTDRERVAVEPGGPRAPCIPLGT